MGYYAGIDVSLKESSVCVVDATGKLVREVKVGGDSRGSGIAIGGAWEGQGGPVAGGTGSDDRAGCRGDGVGENGAIWQRAGGIEGPAMRKRLGIKGGQHAEEDGGGPGHQRGA